MRAVVVAALLVACPSHIAAQQLSGQMDSAAVAAVADRFFPTESARRNIPGLVFVFVSGGEITIARGYGVANLESRRPVDPERTQFRLASVSKVVTATAAMALVEDGRLDLHRDVNSYLAPFQVDARGGVTLHHLLTHTAGFDERLTGVAARSADQLLPLEDYLQRSLPPLFSGPGRVISYSNHGLGLAGLLVQRASGRPFADYVRERVFEPLGMSRSDALLGAVPADLAVAYDFEDGEHQALAPEYLHLTPAGAFFTTGADMGRFLIAHLRAGAYRDRRILRPETVALMHAQQFAQAPALPGWAYGMWEDIRHNHRALLHNGGGKGYRALMYLLPDQDAGFFVAYNLADRHPEGELQEVFISEFRNRFLSPQSVGVELSKPQPSKAFVGEYRYVRRARTTMESFISVVNRIRISSGENGAYQLSAPGAAAVELHDVGPLLFRRSDGRGMVALEQSAGGDTQRVVMSLDSGFPAVYERVPLAATSFVQGSWLGSMVVVFIYAVAAPIHRRWKRDDDDRRSTKSGPRRLVSIASALNLLFLFTFPVAFVGRIEGGFPEFVYGVPVAAAALLYIPVITGILAILAVVTLATDLRDSRSGPRIADSWTVVALLSFVAFAAYWNLLPAKF
jgi:CubicO group peptidase (beta-lactamase class C family)